MFTFPRILLIYQINKLVYDAHISIERSSDSESSSRKYFSSLESKVLSLNSWYTLAFNYLLQKETKKEKKKLPKQYILFVKIKSKGLSSGSTIYLNF